MKVSSVEIFGDDLAAGVVALLAALEPADLAALESAAKRLGGFHALACQLLAPLPDLIPDEEALAALDTPYPSVPAVAQTYCDDKAHVPAGRRHGNSPPPERTPEGAHPKGNAEVAKINRLAVARALAAGPLRQVEIAAATGIPQGTTTGVLKAGLPTGCGWWRRVDVEDCNSGYELAEKGREALEAEGYILPPGAAPTPKPARDAAVFDAAGARDRARCKLIAETLARLIVPLAAFTLARESALNADDVEKRLTRNPQWFERADCVGIKYKLTRGGRELAAEGEVTS